MSSRDVDERFGTAQTACQTSHRQERLYASRPRHTVRWQTKDKQSGGEGQSGELGSRPETRPNATATRNAGMRRRGIAAMSGAAKGPPDLRGGAVYDLLNFALASFMQWLFASSAPQMSLAFPERFVRDALAALYWAAMPSLVDLNCSLVMVCAIAPALKARPILALVHEEPLQPGLALQIDQGAERGRRLKGDGPPGLKVPRLLQQPTRPAR